MSEPRIPWDDDRLASAYRDLTETSTPPELAQGLRRVTASPRTIPGRRRRSVALLAAAVVVTLLVGAVAGALPRIAPGPTTSAPAATQDIGPTPAVSGQPTGVATVPDSITVAGLLAIQQGAFDDRELTVRGYLSPMLPVPCPMPIRQPTPLEHGCPGDFVWLMAEPEVLVVNTPNATSFSQPEGPAIDPALLETSGLPPTVVTSLPPEVIVFGHFDDPRWRACPEDEQTDCRKRFVIDRVIAPDERFTMGFPEPWSVDPAAKHQPADVFQALSGFHGTLLQVLSIGAVDGQELARIDPSTTDASELIAAGPIWLIRIFDPNGSGLVRSYVIRDEWLDGGLRRMYELTESGPIRADGAGPAPSTSG